MGLWLLAVGLPEAPTASAQGAAGAVHEATAFIEAGTGDFRGSAWGASEAEVRQLEDRPPLAREEGPLLLLAYAGRLLGQPCRIVYRFVDDMLAGGYYLAEGGGLSADFLASFERCREGLTHQYGPATKDEILWAKTALAGVRPTLEDALWAGEAHCRAVWDRPPSSITLSLCSVDGPANLKLVLLYESLLLKPVTEQAQKQARRSPESDIMR